jgi:CHAD domain-containing protein
MARKRASTKGIEDWIQLSVESIRTVALPACRDGDPEGFHALRVEIKRLRAALNLAGEIAGAEACGGLPDSVRRLFKAAGLVRTSQVFLSLLLKAMSENGLELSEYYNLLKRDESRALSSFAPVVRGFDPATLVRLSRRATRALGGTAAETQAIEAERHLRGLIDELARHHGRSAPAAEDLHRIRIAAKEARYDLEIIDACFRARPRRRLGRSLRGLSLNLGEWRDADLALGNLERAWAGLGALGLFEPDAYRAYAALLAADKARRLRTFRRRWRSFIRIRSAAFPSL